MAAEPLHDRAEALLDELCAAHPLGYRPRIVWKNLRVSAGIAYYRDGAIALSRIVLDSEERLRDTLTHEYAHLLAIVTHGRRGVGHGQAWRSAMARLGQEPKVRHSYEVCRNSRRQQVGYQCQRCGNLIVRSRRLPRGRMYRHVACGGLLRLSFVSSVTPGTLAT